MSKMKMWLPRSVTSSLRRSGATNVPLGQARPRAVITNAQPAGIGILPMTVLVVVSIATSAPSLPNTRWGTYMMRRTGSQEGMSVLWFATVQPGIGMTVATVRFARGTGAVTDWASTLENPKWGRGPSAARSARSAGALAAIGAGGARRAASAEGAAESAV